MELYFNKQVWKTGYSGTASNRRMRAISNKQCIKWGHSTIFEMLSRRLDKCTWEVTSTDILAIIVRGYLRPGCTSWPHVIRHFRLSIFSCSAFLFFLSPFLFFLAPPLYFLIIPTYASFTLITSHTIILYKRTLHHLLADFPRRGEWIIGLYYSFLDPVHRHLISIYLFFAQSCRWRHC